ncbi:MAG: PilW family protein [Planctomycetota bacterium]|jgi:prepilin-type N-terminal cleavage/methylation domain-containing protein
MGGKAGKTGFTLMEVMVSVSIFSFIMIAVAMVYITGTRAYRQGVFMAQMRLQGTKTLTVITRELIDCRIMDGENYLDYVTYQKPTPRQNALGELRFVDTATRDPFWGDGETEIDGGAIPHVGNLLRLQFVPVATLNEGLDGVDYNRDGDQLDIYERGHIVRIVLDMNRVELSRRILTTNWVFKPALPHAVPPAYNPVELAAMDMDDVDGNQDDPDPVFLLLDDNGLPNPAGGRIQVRLFAMEILNRVPVLEHCETVVTPVNKTVE